MEKRYFEDFEIGEQSEFGEYEVEKDEILEFAEQYDPQPFHVDEETAAQSHFGGLIASGWHSAAMAMRLLVDEYFSDHGSLGSPGVDELEWRRPVRPGDTLSLRVDVVDKRRLDSSESRGLVTLDIGMYNQNDESVLSMVANVLFPVAH